MKKPKIGLISFCSPLINADFSVMWRSYIEAIQDAGGLPVLIPVSVHLEDCQTYMDMVDGLLVPGGEDMHPKFYGEDPVRQVN
ncbi:MAG: gamma-glutamyl-gamma-aminobutyrate hydrolase family protein, partial [Clostridiales bacterium]|nr:gamma-glutamyl-gamma-aminobutyrate hydrolase family protein [Clostridiales bacterium]